MSDEKQKAETRRFDGKAITAIRYGDRSVYVVYQIEMALEYQRNGSMQHSILNDWKQEFEVDRHYVWATGTDAKVIGDLIGRPYAVRRLMLLTEAGLHLACLKTNKRKGRELRAWLAEDVIPQVARTGTYAGQMPAEAAPPVPLAPAQPFDMTTLVQAMAQAVAIGIAQVLPQLQQAALPAPQPAAPPAPAAVPQTSKPKRVSEKRGELVKIMQAAATRELTDIRDGSYPYKIRELDHRLYGEFMRRTGIDLLRLKEQRKAESAPDVAEQLGRLQDLIDIARDMFGAA